MRIGIVTQSLGHNYGGVLQNFALQQVLKRLGHNPITIDYIHILRNLPVYRWLLSCGKTLVLKLIGKGHDRHFLPFPKQVVRQSPLMPFVKRNIERTREVHKYSFSLIKKYRLDAVVIGSDQVWRPRYNKDVLPDMFLRFVRDKKICKMAYAASFGVDYWEFSKEQTAECAKLIKTFDAISVREQSGVVLCKGYLGVNAIEVLDPTLLLSAEDYGLVCSSVPQKKGAVLAAYVLDLSPDKSHFIEQIASQKGLKSEIFGADKTAELTVEEWLAIFRDAAFVITDSFHGTAFSIINRKPFLSIVNEDRGASRFYSLLGKLELEDRLIQSYDQIVRISDVDWSNVELKLNNWRQLSEKFLRRTLNG